MMNFSKTLLILSIVVASMSQLSAQNNCPQMLKKAQLAYDEGRISEVNGILESCLIDKGGFTKEEKTEAHKLLVLTWLYFNERGKAENSMQKFLELDPEYKINEAIDPTEFINLYNSFRTYPILIYGFKIGLNCQDIDVKKNFSVDNSAVLRGNYKSVFDLQCGLSFEIPIKKKWSLLSELNLVKKNYTYKDEILNFAKIDFYEKQSFVELPVMLQYNLSKRRLAPYLALGGTMGYLFNSKAIVTRKDNANGTQLEVSGPELTVKDLRHKLLYNASLGAGFKLKDVISNGYILVDLRINMGLRNSVKPENRFTNEDLIYNYLFLDNDFQMNSFVMTVGFALPSYRPKKLKSKVVFYS